ncbi:MAG TPA: hypothetical protein V6D09_21030 [Leptolyngbyaceae cyanobacterium]
MVVGVAVLRLSWYDRDRFFIASTERRTSNKLSLQRCVYRNLLFSDRR